MNDPALEAQLRDRLSFRCFASLSLSDTTPDHSTLWRFRDELTRAGLIDRVFAEINDQLEAKGLVLKQGTLVDASFLQARARPPKGPKKGHQGPPRPSADRSARWGKKGGAGQGPRHAQHAGVASGGGKSTFGYNIHIGWTPGRR